MDEFKEGLHRIMQLEELGLKAKKGLVMEVDNEDGMKLLEK